MAPGVFIDLEMPRRASLASRLNTPLTGHRYFAPDALTAPVAPAHHHRRRRRAAQHRQHRQRILVHADQLTIDGRQGEGHEGQPPQRIQRGMAGPLPAFAGPFRQHAFRAQQAAPGATHDRHGYQHEGPPYAPEGELRHHRQVVEHPGRVVRAAASSPARSAGRRTQRQCPHCSLRSRGMVTQEIGHAGESPAPLTSHRSCYYRDSHARGRYLRRGPPSTCGPFARCADRRAGWARRRTDAAQQRPHRDPVGDPRQHGDQRGVGADSRRNRPAPCPCRCCRRAASCPTPVDQGGHHARRNQVIQPAHQQRAGQQQQAAPPVTAEEAPPSDELAAQLQQPEGEQRHRQNRPPRRWPATAAAAFGTGGHRAVQEHHRLAALARATATLATSTSRPHQRRAPAWIRARRFPARPSACGRASSSSTTICTTSAQAASAMMAWNHSCPSSTTATRRHAQQHQGQRQSASTKPAAHAAPQVREAAPPLWRGAQPGITGCPRDTAGLPRTFAPDDK